MKNFPPPKKQKTRCFGFTPDCLPYKTHTLAIDCGRCREAGGRHPSAPGGGRPVLDTSIHLKRAHRGDDVWFQVAKKWHIYRVFCSNSIYNYRDSSCFGRFWNCMDFPGYSTWCFFVPNHYKRLVSGFSWRNGVHFHFPMFLPTGVQAVGFSNLNVPILNVHIPQIRQWRGWFLLARSRQNKRRKVDYQPLLHKLQFLYHEMLPNTLVYWGVHGS